MKAVLLILFAGWCACLACGESVYRRSMDRVSSLDPADAASIYAARSAQLVYETLLEYDYRARPYRLIPGLAVELPEVQSNGLVYVVRLDPEARFQSDACFGRDADGRARGRAVTADDVVFSLKRLGDRRVASPGEWLVLDMIRGMRAFAEASMGGSATDYARPVSGLEALDERTVRITLTRPAHQFVWYLAMCFTAVVPREAVEQYGAAFGSHAVGSGP
ncbi:MAG: ABC transporter substrate-binding protein, partial [Kiritimatiellia bacterium]